MITQSTAQTGYDSGNAGVFFVCTVPIVPTIAIAIGTALGVMLDSRRDRADRDDRDDT